MAKNAPRVQTCTPGANCAYKLSLRYFSYIFLTSLKFSFKYLNVENIAKTILVALEVSISIFRKDHSVL